MRVQTIIAAYFEEQAAWRRQKAEEYPADDRNLQAAEGLEALSEYVKGLPDGDERTRELATIAVVGDVFLPGSSADAEISRFRFHDPNEDFETFLDSLVRIVTESQMELAAGAGILDDAEGSAGEAK